MSDRLRETLMAAKGYMLNAKIDLETGAPKRTAIQTLEGGLRRIDAGFVASYSDYTTGFRAGIEAAAEEALMGSHGLLSRDAIVLAAAIRNLKPEDGA